MKRALLLICFPVLLLVPVISSFAAKVSKEVKAEDSVVTNKPSPDSLREAMKEFNSLSRSEKKSRFKEMKKAIKQFKADKKAGNDVSTNTLLLVLLSIFIPPLAVYLHEGTTNNRFWIDVLLTILGYVLFSFAGIFFLGSLPGIIYALIVILGN